MRLAIPVVLATLLACSTSGSDGSGSGDLTGAIDTVSTADAAGVPDVHSPVDTGPDVAAAPEDLDMTAEDFDCILEWTHTGRYYLTNPLGHIEEAVAVAESPTGGTFPVGTIVQLVPFEAMVKRAAGWSPSTGDWEFFALDVSEEGTTIAARGTDDVVNQFGGNCLGCHAPAAVGLHLRRGPRV